MYCFEQQTSRQQWLLALCSWTAVTADMTCQTNIGTHGNYTQKVFCWQKTNVR